MIQNNLKFDWRARTISKEITAKIWINKVFAKIIWKIRLYYENWILSNNNPSQKAFTAFAKYIWTKHFNKPPTT